LKLKRLNQNNIEVRGTISSTFYVRFLKNHEFRNKWVEKGKHITSVNKLK